MQNNKQYRVGLIFFIFYYIIILSKLLVSMGCGIFTQENPLIFGNQRQIIQAIKQSPEQNILKYLYEYQNMHAMYMYKQLISSFYNQITSIQANYGNNNKVDKKAEKGLRNREDKITYHMDNILVYVKYADEIITQIQNENTSVKEEIENRKKEWSHRFHQILKQQGSQNPTGRIQSKMKLQPADTNKDSLRFKQIQSLQKSIIRQQSKIRQKLLQSSKQDQIAANPGQIKQQAYTKQGIDTQSKVKFEELQDKLQEMLITYKQQVQNLSQQILRLNSQLSEKLQLIQSKDKQLTQLRDIINKSQKNDEIITLKQALIQRTTDVQFKNIQQNSSNGITEQEKLRRSSSLSNKSSFIYRKFSDSRILFGEYQYHMGRKNQQIVDHLFQPLKICSSTKLFTFDKIKPNNVYSYIKQQHQNLLLLIRLKNNTIVGAFSKLGFLKSMQQLAQNVCFIFSIYDGENNQNNVIDNLKNPKKNYKTRNYKQFTQKTYRLQLRQQSLAKYSARLQKNFLKIGQNQIVIHNGKPEVTFNISSNISIFGKKQSQVSASTFLNTNVSSKISNSSNSKQIKLEYDIYEVYQLNVQYPSEMQDRCKFMYTSEICANQSSSK